MEGGHSEDIADPNHKQAVDCAFFLIHTLSAQIMTAGLRTDTAGARHSNKALVPLEGHQFAGNSDDWESMIKRLHATSLGGFYEGKAEEFMESSLGRRLRGTVQLILTSPPFPLNNKKSYGNLDGARYKEWLVAFAPIFSELLTESGSLVMEIGNAWEPGRPVQSILPFLSLLGFLQHPTARLRLCQEFICYNPARLPSPAQWVTIKRMRMTDSYTRLWWMAKSDFPKANNSRVLRPYSESMKLLLKRKSYNSGKRPSEHNIGQTSFLKRHRGSIMPNFIELESLDPRRTPRLPNAISLSNTSSSDAFLRACRSQRVMPHPARMPLQIASLFIQFLTDASDLVLDPFAGSNTTGFVAERLGRRWVSIEANADYAKQSQMRLAIG
jgi:hypothetical protein